MSLEQPGPRERLAAHLTLVAQVVREHVHRQGRHAHVHLVADGALFSICRIEGAVGLPMAGEVAAGGVVLPTLRAHVLGLRLQSWWGAADHNNAADVVNGGRLEAIESGDGSDCEQRRLFRTAIAGKEGLVGVGGCGFAAG